MADVTLTEADSVISGAVAAARRNGFEALTVLVLDKGGHLVSAKREDGSGILRFEIALANAYGALGYGFGSRTLAARARQPARCSTRPPSPPRTGVLCRGRAACSS